MRSLVALVVAVAIAPLSAAAQDQQDRLRDRGEGVPLSMFGTSCAPVR